jgi:hypothetical protein
MHIAPPQRAVDRGRVADRSKTVSAKCSSQLRGRWREAARQLGVSAAWLQLHVMLNYLNGQSYAGKRPPAGFGSADGTRIIEASVPAGVKARWEAQATALGVSESALLRWLVARYVDENGIADPFPGEQIELAEVAA